jgi:hypothetical protein
VRQSSMRQNRQRILAEERQRTEAIIRSLFDEVTAENPERSYTWVCNEVGKRLPLGVSVRGSMTGRNVRRYVPNPTPRKRD